MDTEQHDTLTHKIMIVHMEHWNNSTTMIHWGVMADTWHGTCPTRHCFTKCLRSKTFKHSLCFPNFERIVV